jgi:hypothetical protein
MFKYSGITKELTIRNICTYSIGSEDEELPWIEQAISNGADSNIEEEVEDLQKKEEVLFLTIPLGVFINKKIVIHIIMMCQMFEHRN